MLDNDRKYFSDNLVNEVLKQEPDWFLPDNFADLVAEKAGRHFAWAQYIREFAIYLVAIIGIFVVTAVMALIWFENDWKIWFDFLISNIWLVAGINILAIFILFADRVLLRYFLYRAESKKDFAG